MFSIHGICIFVTLDSDNYLRSVTIGKIMLTRLFAIALLTTKKKQKQVIEYQP